MQRPFSPSFVRAGSSIVLAALLVLCMRAPLTEFRHGIFALGDLRAFSCAARVALSGADPYRAEPLGACERATAGLQHSDFVIPAPLPGQAIAFFEPLARLPFDEVAGLWCALLCALLFALGAMLARLVDWPPAYALAAVLPLAFMIPIDSGQLVPLAVTLLVAATVAAARGRDAAAALLAAAATIEPHIGLPACAALFIGRPASRPALAAAAAVLAALCVHTIGASATLEYVARVLPEHIAAEAAFDDQYSLTYALRWLHVGAAPALAYGQLSYWLGAGVAVAAALTLLRLRGDVRYLLFVPMAASVAGGPYVHEEHLLAAVPLAVLTAATAAPRLRAFALTTLGLVAWPAKFVLEKLGVPGAALRIATGAQIVAPHAPQPLLADAAWATRIADLTGHGISLAAKVPTWTGLIALCALTAISIATALRGAPKAPCRHSNEAPATAGISAA